MAEREENYARVRDKIFGNSSVLSVTKDDKENGDDNCHSRDKRARNIKKYEYIRKLRNDFNNRKRNRRLLVEAVIRGGSEIDARPYAEVMIQGKTFSGLLDSGASVSLLGKDCREVVMDLGAEIINIFSKVSTASGQQYRILGKCVLEVEYNGNRQNIIFYLCPDLEQKMYLGIDFWRAFKIAPQIVPVSEISTELIERIKNEDLPYKLDRHILTEQQQRQLDETIKKFPSFEKDGLGCTNLEKHEIKLVEGTNPIKDKHYPISPAVQAIVYAEIDNMLKLKVIEESNSPWSNRTTIVRKPGKNRFCLDARKLNAVTVKDAYPLQNIDGILSRIDQTHYISNLKYAFWQIELEEEAKPYTAFTVPGRPLYQFRVMPFGLCNAAQRFCRLMDRVIPARLKQNVFIYLDDLLIISEQFSTHLKILGEVAECLRQANLTIGLKKSLFCFKELRYLGFIIGGGMLKTDRPRKS